MAINEASVITGKNVADNQLLFTEDVGSDFNFIIVTLADSAGTSTGSLTARRKFVGDSFVGGQSLLGRNRSESLSPAGSPGSAVSTRFFYPWSDSGTSHAWRTLSWDNAGANDVTLDLVHATGELLLAGASGGTFSLAAGSYRRGDVRVVARNNTGAPIATSITLDWAPNLLGNRGWRV